MQPSTRIGLLTLTLMSVSAIISLRNLPMMAIHGWASVFYLGLSGILFLIPISLACAELASAWPKKGGVYAWVAEAYGTNTGLLAIWLEWAESVVWLPAVLSFIASIFAYLINPSLANNPLFLYVTMMVVLWSTTFLNFLSIRTTGRMSAMGVLFGTIIPGIVIIGLGVYWICDDTLSQITLTPAAADFVPVLNWSNMVFFTGVLLGFAGIEVAAYHIQDVESPKKLFPQATFLATFLILSISILGALAIAAVLPAEQISLASGVMQAFEAFFVALNLKWMVPILALMIFIGALALLNTWIIGPSRGLYASAEFGNLPRLCKVANRYGSPYQILIMQAVIGTILATTFLLMPSVNASYWILTVLAAQLILMMYFLIFVAVIRLRYTQPDTPRPYQIPGGKFGLWLTAGVGAFSCVFSFLIGFIPPAEMSVGNPIVYSLTLLAGIIIFSLPPYFWRVSS
ncbi:MAG: amino acid permease [Legionellales bacterium]|nr:amino acid permease [Legionellales bacterium]